MLNPVSLEEPRIHVAKWLSIFALICLVVEILFIGNKFGSAMAGFITGQSMGYSIFAVLVFPRRWLKASSIAIIIPITLCFTAVSYYELNKRAAFDSVLKRDGRQLVSIAAVINENGAISEEQIAQMNLGVFSDPVKIINDMKSKIQNASLKYQHSVAPLIDHAFDAETLANKQLRKKYKANVMKIKEQMVSYQDRVERLLNNFEEDMKNSDMPIEMRSSFLAGLKKGMKAPKEYWSEFFELESHSLQAMFDLYEFLDKQDGMFTLVDGQLLFNNESDLEYFNSLTNVLYEITSRQEALEKINKDNVQSGINKIESLLE